MKMIIKSLKILSFLTEYDRFFTVLINHEDDY